MRLVLSLILLLGFSFACDQPYEEVAGYKIGCPFDGDINTLKHQSNNNEVLTQEVQLKNNFFDTARIDIFDGSIEGMTFSKYYKGHRDMGNDFEALSIALKEKWGDAKERKIEGTIRSFIIKDPKSDVLGNVFIFNLYDYDGGSITAAYTSQKILDYNQKVEEEEKRKRIQQFDDF